VKKLKHFGQHVLQKYECPGIGAGFLNSVENPAIIAGIVFYLGAASGYAATAAIEWPGHFDSGIDGDLPPAHISPLRGMSACV